MTKLKFFARLLAKDEEGATAIEYGLLAALISVAIILAVTAVGGQLFDVFNGINEDLGGTAVTAPT